MPRAVADVEVMAEYIRGVMVRADHHAGGVDEIALAIAGAILWKKDPQTQLEVFEREGEMKNVLWVRIGGVRFAVSYNHAGAIEIRRGSTQGAALGSFSNRDSAGDVKRFFDGL